MENITHEQLDFLKRFIVKHDDIDVEEYLSNSWRETCEDFEKEDIESLYQENPELMYMISPFLMYRLQQYYNAQFLCAGWCGTAELSHIYDLIKRNMCPYCKEKSNCELSQGEK